MDEVIVEKIWASVSRKYKRLIRDNNNQKIFDCLKQEGLLMRKMKLLEEELGVVKRDVWKHVSSVYPETDKKNLVYINKGDTFEEIQLREYYEGLSEEEINAKIKFAYLKELKIKDS